MAGCLRAIRSQTSSPTIPTFYMRGLRRRLHLWQDPSASWPAGRAPREQGGVRFFIDECVSPSLSRHLNETGLHDAIHPRDRARLRGPDYVVFARAIAEHRIIVTGRFAQARRRRRSHPVLIILPSVARLEAQR